MTATMNGDVAALLPETALATAAVVGLLAGAWLPRRRQWLVRAVVAAACLVGLAATAATMTAGREQVVFDSGFAVDTATAAKRETEFSVLLALSSAGSLAMLGANDLLMLLAGYLLASVPAYALAGRAKDGLSVEAALKYYLMGALLGVVMLAGVTVLYGAGKATSYAALHTTLAVAPHAAVAVGVVAVFAGLLFKVGGVPAQFWVPDVTDGTPAPVAAFVTTLPKVGGLVAAYRLVHQALPAATVNWPLLVAVLAAASMTLGNLAAFFQTSVKRLLAYSTISQVGYLMTAVAVATRSDPAQRGLLCLSRRLRRHQPRRVRVVAEHPHAATLPDYRGLARVRPGLAAVLVVCLLGLVGTPPTAVFVGKLEIFTAAVDGGYGWLAGLAVANTIASLFYYLRWIAPVFLRAPGEGRRAALRPAGRWSAAGAYTAGTTSLALGLLSGLALPLGAGPLLR